LQNFKKEFIILQNSNIKNDNKMKYIYTTLSAFSIAVFLFSCGALEERKKSLECKDTIVVLQVNEEDETSQVTTEDGYQETTLHELQQKDTISNKKATKYYVILGSFKDKDNAARMSKYFRKKGGETEILTNDKFMRVAYKSYNTKEEAIKELDRMKKAKKNTDAWILAK